MAMRDSAVVLYREAVGQHSPGSRRAHPGKPTPEPIFTLKGFDNPVLVPALSNPFRVEDHFVNAFPRVRGVPRPWADLCHAFSVKTFARLKDLDVEQGTS